MSTTALLRQLPPGAGVLFLVLVWPAVWAAVLMIAALAGDLLRQQSPARSRVGEGAANRG